MPMGHVTGAVPIFQHALDSRRAARWGRPSAIQLVDEGHDRRVAQPAHFHELDGALFDTLGAVDHHRASPRRERYGNMSSRIFVTGVFQQVHDRLAIGETA